MQALQIDVTTVAAIWMGGLIVLVPLAGLTARFALAPILEAVARLRAARNPDASTEELELRFALVEQQLRSLTQAMEQWAEENRRDRDSVPSFR